MYAYSDLLRVEIEQEIEELRVEHSPVLHPDWITKLILNRHPDLSGDDADFFAYNAREHVRGEVRRQLNRYKLKPEVQADRQLVLPGFLRLQEYYLVARGEEHVAVRINSLSEEESRAKYAELIAMAAGVLEHAREFQRYFSSKGLDLAA
jgi:hypothetical protein